MWMLFLQYYDTVDARYIATPWMLVLFQHRGCSFYFDISDAYSISTSQMLILFQHPGCWLYSNTVDARSFPTPRMLVLFWRCGSLFYMDNADARSISTPLMLILFQHRRYPFYSDTTDAHSVPTPRLPVLFRHLRSSFYLTLQMLILFCHPRCLFFLHRGYSFYFDTVDAHSIPTPWMLVIHISTPRMLVLFQNHGCSWHSDTDDACYMYYNTTDAFSTPTPRILVLFRQDRWFKGNTVAVAGCDKLLRKNI